MDTSEWRYAIQDGRIFRGRIYRIDDSDTWSNYMDGDGIIAFYDEGFRGLRRVDGGDEESAARAIEAYDMAREYGQDQHAALDRLAVRLTDWVSLDARFIKVSLDRGMDLYIHSWTGDPDNTWRDEIEAGWHGDVYRIEVNEWLTGATGEPRWMESDDHCDQWYGEDNAVEALAEMYPLDTFPAERVVDSEE